MLRSPSSASPARRRRAIPALSAILLALALGACAGPVAVARVDPDTADRELTANALTAGRPSTETKNVLLEQDLLEEFDDQPEAALAALHRAMVAARGDAHLLFALAELSFLHGEAGGRTAYHLAAVVYAYAFLFPDGVGSTPSRFDPRLRIAADIYNRALTVALLSEDGSEVVPRGGVFALPFGELAVDFDPASLRVGERTLYRFIPVAELSVSGLSMRYRRAGLGAPLAASSYVDPNATVRDFVAPAVRVPVTLILRVPGARRALVEGRPIEGTLDAFLYAEPEAVDIAGERVPLEVEPTAALALTLSQMPILESEVKSFFGGLAGQRKGAALASTTPHQPGRVPVVFVHGTFSSPARWAEMVNRLEADPVIRRSCQFWFFTYNSANPIPYSALQLRKALRAAADHIDPGRTDPAVGKVVLIGHSQGGLLVKMLAIDSGDRFWKGISHARLEDLHMKEETRTLMREALFLEPMPGVGRVIFIATPHRGSYVAGQQLVRNVVRRLVTFPAQVAGLAADIVRNPDAFNPEVVRSGGLVPSAVDNMSPRNRFIRTLADIPLSPRVVANSIIAVEGNGPVAEGRDGMVAYSSAHIDGVESEKVVRSGHSTLGNPQTIEEVRRILRLHLGQPIGQP